MRNTRAVAALFAAAVTVLVGVGRGQDLNLSVLTVENDALGWETEGHPERKQWSNELRDAVSDHLKELDKAQPKGLDQFFTSNYHEFTRSQRVQAWSTLLVEMARRESDFDKNAENPTDPPSASIGLFQLSYENCEDKAYRIKGLPVDPTGKDPNRSLKNPILNIRYAVKILARLVSHNQVIASGDEGAFHNKTARGGARYWSCLWENHVQKGCPQGTKAAIREKVFTSCSFMQVQSQLSVAPVESILQRRHGQAGVTRLLQQIEAARAESGPVSSYANITFDTAPLGKIDNNSLKPAGTPFFQAHGGYNLMTVAASREIRKTYGGIPGGVVMEGSGPDVSEVRRIRYNQRFNAIELDGQSVYVLKISPQLAALLCRAIRADEQEKVGISAADPPIVYGALPDDSPIAWDLLLADMFLGDIVFARNDFTQGYRFAGGFTPVPETQTLLPYNVAVFFTFTDFQFQTDGQEMYSSQGSLAIQLVPLSNEVSEDGNFLPDENAIRAGRMYESFATNARHLAENISYYRREAIVNRAFAYGETVAFLRSLKHAGFNVTSLAEIMAPSE